MTDEQYVRNIVDLIYRPTVWTFSVRRRWSPQSYVGAHSSAADVAKRIHPHL